jgi:hypothetical protein
VARSLGDHRQEKEAKLAVVEEPAAPVPVATSVAFAMAVMVIGEVIGWAEMMAGAVSVSMLHEV